MRGDTAGDSVGDTVGDSGGGSAGSGGKPRRGWAVRIASFVGWFAAAGVVGVGVGLLSVSLGGGSGGPVRQLAGPMERAADSAGDPDGAGGVVDEVGDGEGNPYAGFRIGDFELVDRNGEAVDASLFDGEVTVLTFFFTSCNGPCPAIARVMKEIQDRTREPVMRPTSRDMLVKRLRLASISVDGGRDTPAVISAFADAYGADPVRWRFLTGDPEAVRGLVRESIGFELREEEGVRVPDPTGAMMNNILHPTRLLLVGPDRRLIGVYAFNDADAVAELVEDALAAMRG